MEMESLYFLLAVVIHFTLVATEPRDLTSSEFKSRLASGDPTFVKFFAPWYKPIHECSICSLVGVVIA